MGNRICSHCGKEVPEGSHFCNQCGMPISQEVKCPFCGEEIPAESRFCPKCGRPLAVAKPAESEEPKATRKNDSLGIDFNEEEETQSQPVATPPAVSSQYNEAYDEEEEVKHRNYGPIIAAIVTALILCGVGFYFFQGRSDAAATDVDTVEVPLSPEDAVEILRTTLNKENRLGDLANVAFALEMNPGKNGEKQIAGVTYYSSTTNRSFYKVYTITRDSLTDAWRITYELNRTVDQHWLNFNASEVVGEGQEMPQHITSIAGKDYLYFAYGALPQGANQEGEVVLCLYEAQTGNLVNVTYAGEMVQRDGRQLVYGKAGDLRRTPEAEFLVAQAESAALIYHPTEEDLELEKAENATRKWLVENADNVTALKCGENDVIMNITVYDKPIFSLGDSEEGARIEDDNLIVVADDKGAVYGFSKTKRRYFVLYAPKQATKRSAIRFTSDGSVVVSAASLQFVLNPRTCAASQVENAL